MLRPAKLKIGDRIRIVNVPDNATHPDTQKCFQMLIDRGYSQRISEIDEFGFPWISAKFFINGQWVGESLAIFDDGSWVKVEKRIGRVA